MKKKKRIRKGPYYLLVFIIVLLAGFFLYKGFNLLYGNTIAGKLENLNYSKDAVKLIIDNEIDNYLIKNKIYSKTLEVALIEGEFEEDNLEDYVYFEYKDYDKYVYHLNELKKLNYRNDEIKIIFDHLEPNDIDIVINKQEQINNLASYVIDEYFNINELDRYVEYKKKHDNYSYETVINYVNMNLDYDFYTNINDINNPNSTLLLVNKYHKLSKSFVPDNLSTISATCAVNSSQKVIPIVKDAFEDMCTDMKSVGLTIKAVSSYRSYKTQEDLYNNYAERDGIAAADTYSARPGHSEHQTGMAIDVHNGVLSYTSFDRTSEFEWLKNNAQKYGFIIRYPKGKEDITGYMYEAWHLRYVGPDAATYIQKADITFDEYHAKYIDK